MDIMENHEENGLELNPDDIVEVIELDSDENDGIYIKYTYTLYYPLVIEPHIEIPVV